VVGVKVEYNKPMPSASPVKTAPPPSPKAVPVPLAAPSVARQFTPSCVADFEPDGSLLVTFTISPDMARRFDRERNNVDMAKFMWETRGLKHFEHQRLT